MALRSVFFWLSRLVLLALGAFFLALGISILKGAYSLKTPFEFLGVFFASNLIILISATLCLGFIISMYRRVRSGSGSVAEEGGKEAGNEASTHREGDPGTSRPE